MRRGLFWIAMVLTVLLMIEGLSWFAIAALDRLKNIDYPGDFRLSQTQVEQLNFASKGKSWNRMWDPDLGWTMTPGFHKRGQTVNSLGLCSAHEYALEKPPGIIRIAAFGESNTEAADVSTEDSWPTIIERRIKNSEVLNFGVGGYGPDQCWLRYQLRGRRFKPDIVLICYMTENINRIVNTFRPFYTQSRGLPFTKPYFKLAGDSLLLVWNPIRERTDLLRLKDPEYIRSLGQDDFWFHYRYGNPRIPRWARKFGMVRLGITVSYQAKTQYYNKWDPLLPHGAYDRSTYSYQLLIRILEGFYRQVEREGGEPLIFIQVPPDKLTTWRDRGKLAHAVLLEDLAKRNMHCVDFATGLDSIGVHYSIEELYKGHPSELGNALEAELVIRKLIELGLVDSSRIIEDPLSRIFHEHR